jgi:hypothetical protein
VETGGAACGAGVGRSDPGSGGAAGTLGAAIWPISGTTLGVGADSEEGRNATGRAPTGEGLLAVSNFTARPICTTASTHSVPQAIAEDWSRSVERMVEGGVTGC